MRLLLDLGAERIALGLISGTSMDGIDAAVVRLSGDPPTIETLSSVCQPYSESTRLALFDLIDNGSLALYAKLDRELGELFSDAGTEAIRSAGLQAVDVVGSHGQTVWHEPNGPFANTVQIGSPAVIARRLQAPVVADFRTADIAAGGQGAPLVPYLDWLVLKDRAPAIALNIGGIANLTIVQPGGPEKMIAFDAGPGNCLIDLLANRATGEKFDRDGGLAALGQVDEGALDTYLNHAYFAQLPPKSTGRELFNKEFLGERAMADPLAHIATITELTARSIAQAIRHWAPNDVKELYISGGGLHNKELVRRIENHGFRLHPYSDLGIDSDAKEAILFAVLADARLRDAPVSFPGTTGVSEPTRLGAIYW